MHIGMTCMEQFWGRKQGVVNGPGSVQAFRTQNPPGDGKKPESEVQNSPANAPIEEEMWIVCRQCQQRLTRPSHRIPVNGSARHSFANPSGIIFEIECYAEAQGCQVWGKPSREFAWFAGYSWEILICSRCSIHLGWLFTEHQSSRFFGLISAHLAQA